MFTQSPMYHDLQVITERLTDDSMTFEPDGIISGTGAQSGSIDKNFHIAQHNDRVFLIAKTALDWDDFVNFTSYDKSVEGYPSIKELIDGDKTGQGVARKDLRFLLS